MTSDNGASARPSARVDRAAPVVPGQSARGRLTAPETMDDSAHSGTRSEGGVRRMSRRRLDEAIRSLSPRDRAVLQSVHDFGLLRTTHLQQLHFTDHATPEGAARIWVLRALADRRFIEPIERRIGGIRAGSEGTVWRIGPAGHRLLRDGDPEAPRARRREPSLRFLEHRMLVADVVCGLTTAANSGSFELVDVAPEPRSWRTYSGHHGSREVLKPDLFVVTATDDYEDHWFVEVDRGTESVPTLLKQCVQYERYRRSGTEQRTAGLFPRVLWLVPDLRRRDRITAAIRADGQLDGDLFRVEVYAALLGVVTGGAS